MHVFINDAARLDLSEIWAFVAKRSPEAADRLVEELIVRAVEIGESPFIHRVVIGRDVDAARRVNHRSWAIFYEITEGRVEILSFVQGKTNPRRLNPRRR